MRRLVVVGILVLGGCTTGLSNSGDDGANEADMAPDFSTPVLSCVNNGQCAALPHAAGLCGASMTCMIATCDSGFKDCDGLSGNGCEAATQTDSSNCGACGTSCIVANGSGACMNGKCVISSCNGGFANCDGLFATGCSIPTSSDIKNCGSCAHPCSAANGTPSCANGMCGIASCAMGFADCDMNATNGCEAQIATDTMNCGGCGKACMTPSDGTAACVLGVCSVGLCNLGHADCDKMAANGCEADLSSLATCGQCGTACAAPANATAGCNAGVCGIGACNPNFDDCDKSAANGCEKSLLADISNCGACGKACVVANGTPECLNGQCGIGMCNSNFKDCDHSYLDGCEVNTAMDASNCGACGTVCPVAMPSCVLGQCSLVCDPGKADCDHSAANGCEVNIVTDSHNCGGCGMDCASQLANSTRGCTGGVCMLVACFAGWGDCDGMPANGCEASLNQDTRCGGCGVDCTRLPNATGVCAAGACTLTSCAAGFSDCDKNSANGCEANLNTDPKNCKVCGMVCPNGVCAAGVCSACPAGFADCNMNPADGCEVNLANNVSNCGACGMGCPAPAHATATCSGGKCGGSCNDIKWGDCNNNMADGCETDLTTADNCYGCGILCTIACSAQFLGCFPF